ncbi:Hypothetical protein ACI5QL_03156 [Bacillus velezensis]|uniref:Uncharacterized protein n=1 Tax=Bacillus amyloliquefaciens (strain Y2) TaxID=1155777 RepID=I2C9E6_BACAY|nr:hypothetical protein MUS_3391 [Bacillus velezensis YAU B9601-Y2]
MSLFHRVIKKGGEIHKFQIQHNIVTTFLKIHFQYIFYSKYLLL